jgi:hypothetical protein
MEASIERAGLSELSDAFSPGQENNPFGGKNATHRWGKTQAREK